MSFLEQFAHAAAAATPAPWRLSPQPGAPGRFQIFAETRLLGEDLSEGHASYLVSVRNQAASLAAPDPSKRTRRLTIEAELRRQMIFARDRSLFIAAARDGTFYLHDTAQHQGRLFFDRQTAAFFADAKLILIEWLNIPGFGGPRTAPSAGRIVIPSRRPATVDDVAATYADFARPEKPLGFLAGRHGLRDRTEMMMDAILARLHLDPNDRVLDLGCGDGAMIRRLAPYTAAIVGTAVSGPEVERLRTENVFPNVSYQQADFDTLQEIEGTFDLIIVNGSIHFVGGASKARRVLTELAGKLTPGGRLFIGEMLSRNFQERHFKSIVAALRYARELHGTRFAQRFLWHVVRRRHRLGSIVDPMPTPEWHVRRETFAAMAAACGLRIEHQASCHDMVFDDFYRLQDRHSCWLARADALSDEPCFQTKASSTRRARAEAI